MDKVTVNKIEDLSPREFNDYIYSLLREEPIYAAVSLVTKKVIDNNQKTLYVTVNRKGFYELHVNSAFFNGLNNKEKLAVIQHEFLHIMLAHLTDRFEGKNPTIWNWATDLAINCHIPDLPSMTLLPGRPPFQNFPKNEGSEQYYNRILAEAQRIASNGVGDSNSEGGSHEHWGNDGKGQKDKEGEGSQAPGSFAKQSAYEKVRREVTKAATSNSWGNVHQDVREIIQQAISYVSMVDWRVILRQFVGTRNRASANTTVRKMSKKYPFFFGRKIERLANIAISIDQSGSVDDQTLAKFERELNKLKDLATFTVIPFDTEVSEKDTFVWKKGQKIQLERVACGGTNFDAPTRYVNENGKFEGHVILTDLCAPIPMKSRCKRLWIAYKNNYDRNFKESISEPVILIE